MSGAWPLDRRSFLRSLLGGERRGPRFALREIAALPSHAAMALRPRLAVGVRLSASRDRLALAPPRDGAEEVVFPAASLEAEVCRACDGERTLAQIAAALSAAGETGEGETARRVLAAFHALVERGVCEPVNAPPE